MENTGNFRKALLGFNRSDVMEYIAMLHNEYYAYRQESEKEIYDLRIKIAELEEKASEEEQEAVFGAEHEEILADLQSTGADKMSQAADRLEGILCEIEELLNNKG
ncbi:MAG: hypothetical protein IJC79_06410 [Clostridia bacterium]|nr:hypothetical protein [Clostridia bacterium]